MSIGRLSSINGHQSVLRSWVVSCACQLCDNEGLTMGFENPRFDLEMSICIATCTSIMPHHPDLRICPNCPAHVPRLSIMINSCCYTSCSMSIDYPCRKFTHSQYSVRLRLCCTVTSTTLHYRTVLTVFSFLFTFSTFLCFWKEWRQQSQGQAILK